MPERPWLNLRVAVRWRAVPRHGRAVRGERDASARLATAAPRPPARAPMPSTAVVPRSRSWPAQLRAPAAWIRVRCSPEEALLDEHVGAGEAFGFAQGVVGLERAGAVEDALDVAVGVEVE